jgi:hypothetical protein
MDTAVSETNAGIFEHVERTAEMVGRAIDCR